MNIFYARCSTEEQNEARQLELAKSLHCEKIFLDKASGKSTNRVELKKMLDYAREGDTIIVSEIARLARNTADLLNIVDTLNSKGVKFISQKEAINTDTPQGKFMLSVFGAMAELERAYILQRQAEGIAIAKENGIYKGRKPKDIDEKLFSDICKRWRAKEITAVSIQKRFEISAPTFYAKVKERGL